MSELKAYELKYGAYGMYLAEDGHVVDDNFVNFVYPKDQTDKVIARHKYKRCLAMANGCADKIKYWHIRYKIAAGYDRSYEKWKHTLFIKWRTRFLDIADKFKEA